MNESNNQSIDFMINLSIPCSSVIISFFPSVSVNCSFVQLIVGISLFIYFVCSFISWFESIIFCIF